jgi:arsenate reductase-like glutaredoxin family protein
MTSVQIFGTKNSQTTRAAERFFKERRIPIQFVDLAQRPMAPGEIRRFADRFGLQELIDREGKPFESAGLKYMRVSDSDLLGKIEAEPKLLKLPLVRAGNLLSIGQDTAGWTKMIESVSTPR